MLDEKGILTDDNMRLSVDRLSVVIKQRDALLDLFESWVDQADDALKTDHYKDYGQGAIAYLYKKLAELRAK